MRVLVISAMASLAAAQATYSNGTFTCAKPGAAYCAGDSLSTDIIIRCDENGKGTPGRCEDNLAGEPPLGVNPALCWQKDKTSGIAACEKNCVVYGGSGSYNGTFTLGPDVCTPYSTAPTTTPTTAPTTTPVPTTTPTPTSECGTCTDFPNTTETETCTDEPEPTECTDEPEPTECTDEPEPTECTDEPTSTKTPEPSETCTSEPEPTKTKTYTHKTKPTPTGTETCTEEPTVTETTSCTTDTVTHHPYHNSTVTHHPHPTGGYNTTVTHHPHPTGGHNTTVTTLPTPCSSCATNVPPNPTTPIGQPVTTSTGHPVTVNGAVAGKVASGMFAGLGLLVAALV